MHPTEPASPGQDPTEKTDLVDRLQSRAGAMSSREGESYRIPRGCSNLLLEAADEIRRLRLELKDLRPRCERNEEFRRYLSDKLHETFRKWIADLEIAEGLIGEIDRLRAERDKLIDGNISASGPMASKFRYTAFPDQSNEEWFDTMAEARAHVRSCFGLEVES